MRLLYDPAAHERERSSWKTVIHLNLITAVRLLLEAIEKALEDQTRGIRPTSSNGAVLPPEEPLEELEPSGLPGAGAGPSLNAGDLQRVPSTSILSRRISSAQLEDSAPPKSNLQKATLLIRLRLAPLLSLEGDLRRRLGAVGDDVADVPAYLSERRDEDPIANPYTPASGLRVGRMSSLRSSFGKLPGWRGTNSSRRAAAYATEESLAGVSEEAELETGDFTRRTNFNSLRGDDLVLKAGWQDRLNGRRGSADAASTNLKALHGGTGVRASIDSINSHEQANKLRARDEDDPQALLLACIDEIEALWSASSSAMSELAPVVKAVKRAFVLEKQGAATQ